MRAQTAVSLFTCCLAVTASSVAAGAQAADSPVLEALRFFDRFLPGDAGAILSALRPPPASLDQRARARAVLPNAGELPPNTEERRKLSALEAVLVYHERRGVFDIKVIDLPQAYVGLPYRAVLLISRPTLGLLSAAELQAIVAHEIGHDYLWKDFDNMRERRDRRGRQALELKCDGIAVLTLVALGLDPGRLADALRKGMHFNEKFGPGVDADHYPPLQARQEFARALHQKTQRRRSHQVPQNAPPRTTEKLH